MRILYISYFFPPLGGPAAIRNYNNIKYLCRLGWQIDLITVAEVEYLFYDESMKADFEGLRVYRAPSWDLMSILRKLRPSTASGPSRIYRQTPERIKLAIRRLHPIDDKIGWLPGLLSKGKALIAENSYDLIYVSCGPFSSAIGAYQLSVQGDIPLVYEARDYWNLLSDYELNASSLHKSISYHWEKKVLGHCKLFVAATEGIRQDCLDHFEHTGDSITIYNGWDEEDFAGKASIDEPGWSLAYFGSIYARRSLKHFYEAISRLENEGLLPKDTKIKLYGNYNREALDEISESGIENLIEIVDFVPHEKAVEAMLSASVLLLVINSSSPRGTLSSKLFEYLRSQKPILAMVPAHHEAAQFLRDWGHDTICAMESSESIYLCLKGMIADRDKEHKYKKDPGYSREAQIQKLHQALNRYICL